MPKQACKACIRYEGGTDMWLDEVKKAAVSPEEVYERIASHREPVMVYGTGGSGKKATELLDQHGIEVAGYVTGREYLPASGEYLGKPVYPIDGYMSYGGGYSC